MEFAAISFVFSLAIQLQVCLVALERVDVDNIVLHAPEQYHVACGKVSPVADLKQRKQKSRQCRGKEEESDTACCIGTPEHCGLIRRDLVVCPPFWLLPRIETGDSFLWACGAPLLRPHPQGNVPAWAFAGRTFRRLWGMSVPFSLNAPLLCQTIVAILCGNFEQFANKRPAHKKDC